MKYRLSIKRQKNFNFGVEKYNTDLIEIKNSLEGLNSRFEIADKSVNSKIRSTDTYRKKKGMSRASETFWTTKHINILIMGILEGEGKKGPKNWRNNSPNFPNLMENINPHIQEAQQIQAEYTQIQSI